MPPYPAPARATVVIYALSGAPSARFLPAVGGGSPRAVGHGVDAQDYAEKRTFQVPRSLIAPHNPDRLLAVYVAGDSMIDAHICDSDIAIFHPGITEDNRIFVVSIGNSLVVKRVDRDLASQTLILISANPAYEPRRFTGQELEDIRIAGRVVACYHRV
ncbi:MAG: hypothetical protein Pg6A_15280 [Termitinemataceae bacterium]|nr:MAG: hypothetical protein Pg6A_15280 [Termitinemataceae bacterium]